MSTYSADYHQPGDGVPTPLVVGPDDYLVINMGLGVTQKQVAVMRAQLKEFWPDQRIVVVSAQELAIIRKENSEKNLDRETDDVSNPATDKSVSHTGREQRQTETVFPLTDGDTYTGGNPA
jgi:hypothetical protein